jgi:hypothetical protein
MRRATLASWFLAALASCALKVPEARPPDTTPLEVGQSRDVTLRYLRFDITGFKKTLTKADLLALPLETRRRLWLLDLNIAGTNGAPRLIDNSLRAIRDLNPDDPNLGTAEKNMVRLLQMTPDTARLQGTSMEEMLNIAPRIGLSTAQVLADAMGINTEQFFLPLGRAKEAILQNVIRTHPNAVTRLGPKAPGNPEGIYAVPEGHLPVTLEDAASDFQSLTEKFGAYNKDGVYHPGFVAGEVTSSILLPNFSMTVKANPNALPFKGVDGTRGAIGSVNSIGNDRRALFDFSDPGWIKIEGLREGTLQIDKLTFQITESPRFLRAGNSPLPAPYGNGVAWLEAPWTFERVVLDGALREYGARNYSREYFFGSNTDPLVKMEIVDGWLTVETAADLGSPPPPLYIADMLLEAAQVRLHDGPDAANPDQNRLAEGAASLRFSLSNIPIGITADRIRAAIQSNLEADPTGLIDVASQLFDNGSGEPDFFYVRAEEDNAPEQRGDWLFFVGPNDMGRNSDGTPKRDYARYSRIGFFADRDLGNKISTKTIINGDDGRDKVRIDPDDPERRTVYYQDDDAAVFEVTAQRKPSARQIVLRVTRLR